MSLAETLKKAVFQESGSPLAIKLAALNTACLIMIGAAGGHKQVAPENSKLLKEKKYWTAKQRDRYNKGKFYQLVCSMGLFVVGLHDFRFSQAITVLLFAGNIMFCLPAYLLAFKNKCSITMAMPFGGIFMILGYLLMAF